MKFLNGTLRNVDHSSANIFVGGIDAIQCNARHAACTATNGDRRKARLSGIKSTSILNLDARLKLRKIKEVSTVDRQLFNLLRRQYTLYRSLLRVYHYGARNGLNYL